MIRATRGLRIAYIVQQFPPEVGAGPARVTEMARRWTERGAEVTVLTGMPVRSTPGGRFGRIHPQYRGRLFVEESWEQLRVLRSWLYSSSAGGFGRTLLNNATFMTTATASGIGHLGPVDVVIASSPPFLPHVTGVVVSTVKRTPVILELRDLWPDYLVEMGVLRPRAMSTRALFALERGLLKRASRVVVVTEAFRRRVIAKGVAAERTAVVPNGVDSSLYYPAHEASPIREMRRDKSFLVGYLGGFGAGQALEVVLDAAAILEATAPDVHFTLVGDGPARSTLTAALSAHRRTNVSLYEPIPKSSTRAFYNACDVLLVPLAPVPVFQDTVPSKLFEIMACARPVLGAFDGEARKIVEQSGAGLVVAPGDAGAIASGILRLRAMSGDERAAFGERGRRYAGAHYDRIALADQYLDLLTDTVGVSPSRQTVQKVDDELVP